jgi:hypothetical protein
MKHARLLPRADEQGLATGHTTYAMSAPEPVLPEGEGWLFGAAGIYASAEDLARWELGLMEGKVLKPKSWDLMKTPRLLADGTTRNYACGLGTSVQRGETVYGHTGAVSGFMAYAMMIPRTKSAVVMLSNSESGHARALYDTLVGLVLKDGGRPAVVVPKVEGPSADVVVLDLVRQMTAGAVDRSKLGEAYGQFLDEARLQGVTARLKELGELKKTTLDDVGERGGMEVASVTIAFANKALTGVLYRTPDGKVQELLLEEK